MPGKARRCSICIAALLVGAATAAFAGGDESVPGRGQGTAPVLTGRVVDTEGRPIPGVKIWSVDEEPLAITGTDGTFVLHGLPPVPLLAVCPSGWVHQQIQPLLLHSRSIELRLQPATRISGRVVDNSGEPAAGVRVWAAREGGSGGCIRRGALPPCLNGYEGRSVITDSEGRFVFEDLFPGWFEIKLPEEGEHQLVRRRGVAGRGIEGIEFVLAQKSVPVEGSIVDADGVPVAGAQVTLSGARPMASIETDAAGEFRIPVVLSGRNHLKIEHPDQGRIEQDVEIEGRPVRLDLQMPLVTVVQGRIVGPDGAPVKKVFLTAGEEHIDVAADGTFRFTAPPGEHAIAGQSFEPRGTVRTRLTARGEPIDLELRLGLPGTIRVRLTGLPPGERGYVDLKDRPEGVISGAEKDLHSLDNVPPGEWTLVASDSNGRTFERFAEVGEGETVTVDDIDFPSLPSIRGRVLDSAGRPSEQAIVTFMQGELEISAEADSAGSFLAWLREGAWTIRAEHEGSGPAIATVELSGDAPVELPDLRLVRLVAVSGRVVSADPEVVIPWVRAESEDDLTSSGSAVEQDNRFSLPDLWPGTWTLSTDIDGRPVSTTLQIPPGATEVRIDWEVVLSADREMVLDLPGTFHPGEPSTRTGILPEVPP